MDAGSILACRPLADRSQRMVLRRCFRRNHARHRTGRDPCVAGEMSGPGIASACITHCATRGYSDAPGCLSPRTKRPARKKTRPAIDSSSKSEAPAAARRYAASRSSRADTSSWIHGGCFSRSARCNARVARSPCSAVFWRGRIGKNEADTSFHNGFDKQNRTLRNDAEVKKSPLDGELYLQRFSK